MSIYTVHEPPLKAGESTPDPDRFVFVRDGFSFWAFLLAPLWMLRHRLWLVFVGYVIVAVALQVGLRLIGASSGVIITVSFLLALLVGFEAATLRRFTLSRRRWSNVGVVVGDDLESAERRFFDTWVDKSWTDPSAANASAAGGGSRRSFARHGDGTPAAGFIRGPRPVSATGSVTVSVAIIDYGSGNLHSAAKAFERAAREEGLNEPIMVTSDPEEVRRADRVVLPGVGAFADCRRGLDAVGGMVEALNDSVRARARPFLGICVGMQLMAERGREYEVIPGLGWIPGEVDRIAPSDPTLKIPHMGWNTLNAQRPHPLFDGIDVGADGLHAYFVHSYHLKAAERADLIAEADYGGPVTAVVGRDTMVGTQFHPEKSQRLGLRLIANFLKWKP